MKPYEKPRLVALSLSGNDMLCGGCTYPTRNSSDGFLAQLDQLYGNGDGFLESSELGPLFAKSEGCATVYEGYCKFSAADENMSQLFTS